MFSYLSLTGRLCTCQRAFRSHNVLVKAAYLIWRLPRHKVWIQRWAPNSGTSSHTCSSLESNYIYCTLWPIQSHSFPLQCEKHVTEVMDLSEFCLLTFIFLDRRIKCSLLDWQNVVTKIQGAKSKVPGLRKYWKAVFLRTEILGQQQKCTGK